MPGHSQIKVSFLVNLVFTTSPHNYNYISPAVVALIVNRPHNFATTARLLSAFNERYLLATPTSFRISPAIYVCILRSVSQTLVPVFSNFFKVYGIASITHYLYSSVVSLPLAPKMLVISCNKVVCVCVCVCVCERENE